jgi:hypothetical protein
MLALVCLVLLLWLETLVNCGNKKHELQKLPKRMKQRFANPFTKAFIDLFKKLDHFV